MAEVSVVIPVHNGVRYLGECIGSVLGQTLAPREVIVVDDGSTDGSAEAAESFGAAVTVLRRDRGGPAAARNAGIVEARGPLLAFIDADDIWEPGKLALQAACMKENPGLDMVFGLVRNFHSPETDDGFRSAYACPAEPVSGFHPGTMLIRRDVFLGVGLFDETIRYGEFLDWMARAEHAGLKAQTMPEVFLHRRIHPLNYGITHKDLRKDYLRVVHSILKRKKA